MFRPLLWSIVTTPHEQFHQTEPLLWPIEPIALPATATGRRRLQHVCRKFDEAAQQRGLWHEMDIRRATHKKLLLNGFSKRRCPKMRSQDFLLMLVVGAAISIPARGSDYSNLVQSHSPAAYWRLGETSGTTAVDTTGAHNGTYQNSVTLGSYGAVASDTNKAANFSGGVNDRVQVNPFGVSGSGLTILAWFKADAFGDDHFVSKADGSALANVHWMLGVTSSSQLATRIKIGGTTRELLCSVSGMSTGAWYFAAVTYDGAAIRVYRDGVEVGSAAYTGALSNDSSVPLALGNLPSGAGNRAFDGVLDEVAVFDKALTPGQIYELYTTGGGGLVGHWKLTETTSTTANDGSARLNHGTYTNGVALGTAGPYPGPGDIAANFDGSNDYVAIPNEALYDLAGPMSVAAWIKVNQFDNVDQAIVTKGNNAWQLKRAGSTNRVDFYCNSLSTTTVDSSVDVNDGRWHHIVGVYTGSQLQIYVDGVLSNSVSASGTIHMNNRDVHIARSSHGASREWDGALHDVRIYGRALSACEIAEIYGLIGHWKLDEYSGTVAADSSGTGRNGTVNGTADWAYGAVNNALQFDGATHVEIPGLMKYPKNVSLAAWANLTAADSAGAEVVSLGDCVSLRLDDGSLSQATFFDGSNLIALTLSQTFANTGWHHFAVVFNDHEKLFELYVDGVLAASTAAAPSISYTGLGTDTFIGAHGNGQNNRDFTGRLDDVRVYNRPLASMEVQTLFNQGGGPSGVKIIKWMEIQ
jgi:hypothetical protein